MTNQRQKVFVGLSGGVDSSVAALRLLREGHDVHGVFIKTWQPDFIQCDWEKERLDAMRVAAHLGIPFLTCDAEKSYRDEVAQYMIDEYREGRTPNPDVMCNKYVKFDAFLTFALQKGADKIATGHYARVEEDADGIFHLFRGVDHNKDQSYFLWTLTQEQLKYTLFPVGDSEKESIRQEAEDAELPTFSKQDSQGVCFLGDIDMKDFISHYIETEPGELLNEEGKVIGTHEGVFFYTVGQRHGFLVDNINTNSKPFFVVSKNTEDNTVTVSDTHPTVQTEKIILTKPHAISEPVPDSCKAQFRYRQKAFNVLFEQEDKERGILTVQEDSVDSPSTGQSCVFYNKEECLGGAIIDNSI